MNRSTQDTIKMEDYTAEVIAYYCQRYGTDEDDLSCYEINAYIDIICESERISEFLRDYVDFARIICDDEEVVVYVRHSDGKVEPYKWGEQGNEGIRSSPRNSLFVITA